jgi:predicted dehydrogenase
MAGRLDEARATANAAEKAGTTLAVNWPIASLPALRTLNKLVDEKAIGEVWEVR